LESRNFVRVFCTWAVRGVCCGGAAAVTAAAELSLLVLAISENDVPRLTLEATKSNATGGRPEAKLLRIPVR
jgi:hypothetical protein